MSLKRALIPLPPGPQITTSNCTMTAYAGLEACCRIYNGTIENMPYGGITYKFGNGLYPEYVNQTCIFSGDYANNFPNGTVGVPYQWSNCTDQIWEDTIASGVHIPDGVVLWGPCYAYTPKLNSTPTSQLPTNTAAGSSSSPSPSKHSKAGRARNFGFRDTVLAALGVLLFGTLS